MKPDALRARLRDLAFDLWWSWSPEAQRPFAALDPVQWEATNHSPLATLRRALPARLAACAEDLNYLKLVERARTLRRRYRDAQPWFERSQKRAGSGLRVAYLCSEYALHESIPQYSGGLGVLAGDHLKSASDLGVPLVAVGLLYRHGYYLQELARDGATRALYPNVDLADLPLLDTGVEISCPIGRRQVRAKVWRMQVGRVPLYLLDADLPGTPRADRELTQGLYKGEPELRLRQQVLLGVGGVRALEAVGERPTVWHLNEGHAAFAGLERLRRLRAEGLDEERALEELRRTTIFTTHTPVAAGHDRYESALAVKFMRPTLQALGWTAQRFSDFGREHPGHAEDKVCMTVLALNMARQVNGVSELHGEVSRHMWQHVYGIENVDHVPIFHVTNGVHVETWLPEEARELYHKHLSARFVGAPPRPSFFERGMALPNTELWELRARLRRRLVQFVRERLVRQALRRGEGPEVLSEARAAFDEGALTIGFARRFATYKRAPLVFRDLERLAAILGDPERPVQLVFAGKAHPRDLPGQAFARKIHRLSRHPELRGRVALIEDYDMGVGRVLTAGCDIWLNTPLRPHEASGTSGMKPPLVGGLNLSIPDGWWPEAADGRNGWTIGEGEEFGSRKAQDEADAEELYRLLEEEVVPAFYERTLRGLPRRWLRFAKRSLATVPVEFNSGRMVAEYTERAYLPANG